MKIKMRKAIKDTIKEWKEKRELAQDGYGVYYLNCPLCKYSSKLSGCMSCPVYKIIGEGCWSFEPFKEYKLCRTEVLKDSQVLLKDPLTAIVTCDMIIEGLEYMLNNYDETVKKI